MSLLFLLGTALVQAAVFLITGSVALFADLVHNVGDAATAFPLLVAFLVRSRRIERWAGLFVSAMILATALVAGATAVERLFAPRELDHLLALGLAGLVGFFGNEAAAVVRIRAGRRIASAALTADGYHARADGLVSLGVVASAAALGAGYDLADPAIGLIITAVIVKISWSALQIMCRDDVA